MKKSLLALAVLSAFASAASAQSSVTLSGGIDAAIQRQNGDWNMSTGNSGRTNFTLSGREDLGGGMYAFFAMNYRFNQGTGETTTAGATTVGRFFRQTWVGLGGTFGDVRLGRMLPALQELNGGFDPFGTETIGSVHANGAFNVAGLAGNARVNNAIYYRSPNMGGLQVHANVAAADSNANSAGATGTEKPVGLAAIYAAGPVRVALAYDRNALDLKTTGVYGAFNFGVAEVMAQYENADVTTSDDTKIWSVGARVPFGAAVGKIGYRNWSDAEQKKFAIGLDYNLSKRTIVYTDVAKQSGDGFTSDQKKTMFDVGVWHKF
jgi:predicted porin